MNKAIRTPPPIKKKVFSLLARKDYFSKELLKKLREKGYPDSEIHPLIDDLQKKGFIDDQALAKRFVNREKEKGVGQKLIALKLQAKAGKIDIEIEESEEAVRALVKRRYHSKLPERKNQVIQALLRRGLSFDLIQRVIADFQ